MRDDETGTTGGTTTPPDSSPAVAAAHVVSEHDVRLALTALELEDRALTVHRATAFLTALGVTVTHAPLPATPWSGDPAAMTPTEAGAPASDHVEQDVTRAGHASAPTARVTVRIPAGESDDDSVEGDIANLMEVLAHLQDRLPTPTPEELRSRPRVALPHAQPARPTVRASVRRRSIA
ncbi:hypothetical protein CTKZ_14750 [Cellulomonas algicola]|uniref:Uncharacterized protein n=1 Tax=Cellulomonas algicola TaxID=2071633 RepID=A0A401UYZ4_9CELL|nr:hypothetical protein [Cellulomonas algicola]GCD19913.1 hypothetical protein CTKZ_14750 [Cellulomonas algicola]